jgi:hypothetical protein
VILTKILLSAPDRSGVSAQMLDDPATDRLLAGGWEIIRAWGVSTDGLQASHRLAQERHSLFCRPEVAG